jgi:D-glycero-D-manno-heptose 1,7-bisphosphate phosphatase
MRRATIPQCVILGAHSSRGSTIRDVSRFGVTQFFVEGEGEADGTPTPLAVRVTPIFGTLADLSDRLDERFLLCDGANFAPGDNIAALLADAAADPASVAARVLTRTGQHGGARVAVVRRSAVRPGGTFADILDRAAARDALATTLVAPRLGAPPAPRPALFLDRDGTINVDHGYVGTRDRFEWIDGAREAIRAATEAGWHVFIVTNQSGVARGFFDEDAVRALHDWLADEARRAGGTIDDVRHCPFHPDGIVARYRTASDWRKPAPGMILDLIRAWDLDPSGCVLVGDQPSDMSAAAAAGIAGHLFSGGRLDLFVTPLLGLGQPREARALATG